jgi:hypothetical protein
VDLDYEQFAFADGSSTWATTRPRWVQFVTELGAALHARAKLLTVTVPPIYNGNRTTGSGYWVYDWAGIAPSVDRLRIMAYDYSFGAAGPIAPLGWVDAILAYAVTVVPKSKLQIGVPTYGRSWVTSVKGTCPAGTNLAKFDVRSSQAAALSRSKGAVPVRHASSGEMTFSYTETFSGNPPPTTTTTTTTSTTTTTTTAPTTAAARAQATSAPTATTPAASTAAAPTVAVPARTVPAQTARVTPAAVQAQAAAVSCQVTRTVFYPDVTAVLDRAHLVGKYGISGLTQWALGYEDQAQWQPLRDYLGTLPHPPGVDPVGHVDGVIPGVRNVTVAGWALDPEGDLPSAVVVTIGSTRVPVLARAHRADLASQFYGAGPFHGFTATIPVPAGSRNVCVEALGFGSGARSVPLGCRRVTVAG